MTFKLHNTNRISMHIKMYESRSNQHNLDGVTNKRDVELHCFDNQNDANCFISDANCFSKDDNCLIKGDNCLFSDDNCFIKDTNSSVSTVETMTLAQLFDGLLLEMARDLID